MPPDAPGTLVAPQPVPPERQYSFTDQQVNNPGGQPPGDKLDGEYDRTNQTISDTIAWAATSLNTDGSLKPHVVGESQLVPGLLDDIGVEAVALLQPMVDQTGNYATEALNAVLASNAGATLSGRHATQAGNFADEARKIADTLQAAARDAEDDARSTSSDADRAENAANHADGSEAVAQAYADVGMAWAEHMPDTIPPNILAVQAVTGDHWSARWWANRAAVYAGGGTPGGAAVGTTPDSGVYEPLWWDTNSGQLYVQYNDGSSTQWVAASSIDASSLEGSFLPLTGGTVTGPLNTDTTNTQPTIDYIHNTFNSTVAYTSNGTNGDTLGFVSYMAVRANGHSVPAAASQHTTAIYGNGYLDNDGNAATSVDRVSGVMAVSGNNSPGTLTNGIDFYGHPNYKSNGGTTTNHYFIYQEPSSAATHEYGAYFSAPIGIGTPSPTYNIQLVSTAGGNISFTNWMQLGSTTGQFTVGSNGASFYPGYNPGAGGLGVTDLVVGNNGTQNATSATSNFLYISSCAGTPTGGPAQAALGRIAVTYDTTAHKLWMHDGTSWRGVVLT